MCSARCHAWCFWVCLVGVTWTLVAEESIRPGLEGLPWQSHETIHASEQALIDALREPLLGAKNCAPALQFWLDGRTADSRGDRGAAIAAWNAGLGTLAGVPDLPQPQWPALGESPLKPLRGVTGAPLYLVSAFIVAWKTDAGQQYGVFMVPQSRPKGHRFPLLVYVHGGMTGLNSGALDWLAEQSRKGYAVLAPALRGQALAEAAISDLAALRCDGVPDDIVGDSSDVLAALQGAVSLPSVRPDAGALIGIGRGANVVLLAAARSTLPACVAVADAGPLNPFRYYWSCMSRGENLWPDWAAFCSRKPAEQLADMGQRSVAHQAGAIRAPVFMLIAEQSVNSVDGEAHRDVADRLKAAGREVLLEALPGSQRGFSGNLRCEASQEALRRLGRFVYRRFPPDDGKDALLTPAPPPH